MAKIWLVSIFYSDYARFVNEMQAMNDDAVSINRSINLIIDYFINRLIVAALLHDAGDDVNMT